MLRHHRDRIGFIQTLLMPWSSLDLLRSFWIGHFLIKMIQNWWYRLVCACTFFWKPWCCANKTRVRTDQVRGLCSNLHVWNSVETRYIILLYRPSNCSTVCPSVSKSSFSEAANKHALTCNFVLLFLYNYYNVWVYCIFYQQSMQERRACASK